MLDILRNCPLLEHFHYNHGKPVWEFRPTPQPLIFLPRLRSIDITTPSIGADILVCIDAPALRSIRLDGSNVEESHPFEDDIFSILAKRCHRLQKVALVGISWLPSSFQVLFQDFPRIDMILVFDKCNVTDDILTTGNQKPNWSLLKQLEFHDVRGITGKALCSSFVGERRRCRKSFSTVARGFENGISSDCRSLCLCGSVCNNSLSNLLPQIHSATR
ncbi:hypothetical protein JAAARDRAFT_606272 [Jaapia argillacea MUCL 33604]|uniref:F-box domain-containing protein n=1 Tax=Jaapia argillacea MUCL 33604 TaxID=933084 RepID=A0A067Q050_9AGAM|nr:hypothetical protein JAAARDRAFT_606272 [Jaapia argillacea MUCL 33604]